MSAVIKANGKTYDVFKNGQPIAADDDLSRARVTSVLRARSRSRSQPRKAITAGGAGPVFKRLIVCADGTWLNADNGLVNGQLSIPSNVTRISRAIKDVSNDGIPQVVYYHYGIGGRGSVFDRFLSGTTGEGLDETVREAYSFIANNYTPGDEIFLIGFSRGAFTVRSIAGLIEIIGILTKKGLSGLAEIHQDVKRRRDPNYRPKYPDVPFPNKPSAADPAYSRELEKRGLTTLGVKIKAIGVWDTVGSLGAPRIGWLTKVGLQSQVSRETSFHDTKLGNCVENAFQALALDERRSAFAPALWEKPPGNKTTLRQVWFPGEHSNIGGGDDDQQLANITLAWMMSQLEPFLDFRMSYVLEQEDINDRYYENRDQPIRPYSFGKIPNSMTGLYAVGGGATRTPGQYYSTDPHTKRTTTRLLEDTHEYIHPSVRTRLLLHGPGVSDKGNYTCAALSSWQLNVTYDDGPDPDVYWRLPRPLAIKGQNRVLPESPLWHIERELARRDPETYDFIIHPPATGAKPKRRKDALGPGGAAAGGRASSKRRGPSAKPGSRRARSADGGKPSSRKRSVSRRRPSVDTWELDDEEDTYYRSEREDFGTTRGGSIRGPPPRGGNSVKNVVIRDSRDTRDRDRDRENRPPVEFRRSAPLSPESSMSPPLGYGRRGPPPPPSQDFRRSGGRLSPMSSVSPPPAPVPPPRSGRSRSRSRRRFSQA